MNLIASALTTIQQSLDQYLRNLSDSPDPAVVLEAPFNPDGSVNDGARDKVAMVVYGIRKETSISTRSPGVTPSGAMASASTPAPLYIDIELAFVANFSGKKYVNGLEAIDRVIGYFQQNPVFSRSSAPQLDARLGKLTFDFLNLELADLNYVMSNMGIKYVPSAFYQLRMIPFDSGTIQSRTYLATEPKIVHPGSDRAAL